MSEHRTRVGAGIDAGNAHHWAVLVDDTGAMVWSRKTVNGEAATLDALGDIAGSAEEVSRAVDIGGTASALPAAHGHHAVYVSDRTVNRMSRACSAGAVAATAVAAAGAQCTTLSGEQVTGAEPARRILALDQRLTTIEDQIRDPFHGHPQAGIIGLMPGVGPLLGTELVVEAGDPAT